MVNHPVRQPRIVAHAALLTAALLVAAPWVAAENTKSVSVADTTEKITVDGRLDESVWASTAPIGPLIQRQPEPGTTPSEKTEVRLLHDEDSLYIGIIAYDSEPDRIIGTDMRRDAGLNAEDRLEILLDTFRDQRNAFYFATNPAGALVDGLTFGEQDLNTDWDAIWDLRTARTDAGWVAEMAIPFKSLSFPAGVDSWGFNISRSIYRKQEEVRWSGARLETDFLQVSEAGAITNMAGAEQGIGLDVRPFAAGTALHTRTPSDSDFDGDPGVDVFYNITPSLKLTGTINTDFGDTEVDARQINLTRFSLFFPEKRSFFLEDVGVFDFASTGPRPPGGIPNAGADIFPFFSRRIGLLAGQEVPLDAGLKLTGKIGNTDVGVLGVRTGDTSFVSERTTLVGRFKQNLLEQSYVGGIFTRGDPALGSSARTYGFDTRLATSNFRGKGRNFVFNAFALRSDNRGVSDDDAAFGFSARYPNDKWDGMVVFREIQENFDPALGFVQRNNVRMMRVAASYNPRPKDFLGIQQMFHDIYYTRFERLDNGKLESAELYITPIDWHFRSGDALHAIADYIYSYERLFEPFEIAPGIVLAPGEYRNRRTRIVVGTASKRRLYGFVMAGLGEFWSGAGQQTSLTVTYKMPPWLTVSLGARQTFADLPEGDFIARVFTATLRFSLSPRLSFSSLAQYDNRTHNLTWQTRARWTLRPGNDLFLSFSQGWIRDPNDRDFAREDSKLSAKVQYTIRF